jgi:hypothetical protein
MIWVLDVLHLPVFFPTVLSSSKPKKTILLILAIKVLSNLMQLWFQFFRVCWKKYYIFCVLSIALPVMTWEENCCRRFSEAELRDIKKLFISLAYQSRSHGEFVIASVFQVHNWKQSIPPCCFWSIAVGFEVKFYLVEYWRFGSRVTFNMSVTWVQYVRRQDYTHSCNHTATSSCWWELGGRSLELSSCPK